MKAYPTVDEIMKKGRFVKVARVWGERWNIYKLGRKYYGLSPPRDWIATWGAKA